MNTVVLRRRLFYICAMVALLVPLYFLGTPSVRNADGSVIDQGGSLAKIRTHYNLGQGDLGQIDPASESVRLATLGLRGVASTILWQKAEYYKREQYWDRFSATLNQIAVLQPHFVNVWDFQAHNLGYNVSVEFDDYRQRYAWVKRGINYLILGSKYNKSRTEMPFQLGWFFGSKMGVSDEHTQFRELFRNDDNYHDEVLAATGLDLKQQGGLGPDGKPDNWRAGSLWYERSYDMVNAGSRPAKSTMMFYRMSPLWQIKHSEAIQEEGILDDAARVAWERAGEQWNNFGKREIRTTFGDIIYLNELYVAEREVQELKNKFEQAYPEVYQEAVEKAKAKLSAEQLEAFNLKQSLRTVRQEILADAAGKIMSLDFAELAKNVPEDRRVEALQLAAKLSETQAKIGHIDTYRQQVNYGYWLARCQAEQEDDAVVARTNMYEATKLLDQGELDPALEKYEVAWKRWAALFDKHPAMMIDDSAEDVLDAIERYQRLLDKPDLPADFALAKFLEFRRLWTNELADPVLINMMSTWDPKVQGRGFLDAVVERGANPPPPVKEMEKIRKESEEGVEASDSKEPESGSEGATKQAEDKKDSVTTLDASTKPDASPVDNKSQSGPSVQESAESSTVVEQPAEATGAAESAERKADDGTGTKLNVDGDEATDQSGEPSASGN